EKPNW
ncbi:deCa-heme c-type cytochrome domain protein, partial [Vibrio parahaemolyticus EKP-028]